MSSWKWLPNFIFLICLINLVAIVKSQFPTEIFIHYSCPDNGTRYTRNSSYERNLNTSLSSVPPNIDANGFYNASTGENPDRVNIIALCRADLQPSQCRDYVESATAEILKRCPNKKQATLWHEFCMVRYSDEAIFGTLANSPMISAHSGENVTNTDVFYWELDVLLNSLHDHAAFNSSPKKFAAATRDVDDRNRPLISAFEQCTSDITSEECGSNHPLISAFEQCTPDITSEECGDCLNKSAQQIRECCDGARGVRILSPSCYLRFETDPDPFYNVSMVETVFQPPTPPMPPPPSPQPSGNGKNTSRTIIIIIVPIAVCLILALCIGIYLKTKKMRTPRENVDLDGEISTVESLQYDFSTIRAATDNFSDANKLGQGGFGVVYKVKYLSELLAVIHINTIKKFIGYMAPEYLIHGHFSIKSDVYSFGVLILEIITGQKAYNFQNGESMDDLISFVWKNWHQGTIANIIDPALRTSSGSMRDIMRCIHIGLLCVQENAVDRPTMGSVVLMLSSFSLTLPVPSPPAFFMSDTNGFYNASMGEYADRVNAIALCRGDVQLDICRSCGTKNFDESRRVQLGFDDIVEQSTQPGSFWWFPQEVAQVIPQCCNGKPRFGIFTPSCILQYETYSFYNDTPQPPPAPAPVREPPILAPPADNEIGTVESLEYDFGTIRAATNSFSDANKFGQGGFGVV
ncbi:unnamed protein product [Fraxinus pennsylvanica]|uniref:Gnk2-homologous domain-containing protein n=1 Tax=Fraxinus pennsylvanica TaxID=56036 RepID=A0AAD2AH36_9LAMI|nr:unnamed protein product [Fraxinus pennsylvanica]